MEGKNKLLLVKLLHTIIWVFFAGLVFYILFAGLNNAVSRFTWIAIGLVIGEGLVLAIFRWNCPLTIIARNYSDSTMENFDIFLPEWLAKHNKSIFTTLFLIGLILAIIRSI